MTKEIPATIHLRDKEPKDVVIIDHGEGYGGNGEGQTPNHDKVEVIYSDD